MVVFEKEFETLWSWKREPGRNGKKEEEAECNIMFHALADIFFHINFRCFPLDGTY